MKTLSSFGAFHLAGLSALLVVGCGSDVLNGNGGKTDLPPVKIIIESARALNLDFQEVAPIKVRVLNMDDSPAVEREIAFAIVGTAGGSRLALSTAKTDADGRITDNLTSGDDKTTYQVMVSEVTAETQAVDVTVDGIYKGELKIRFQYSGLIPLQEVSVRVHEGALNCTVVDAVHPPVSVASGVVASPASVASFTGLRDGVIYTATATARGRSGDAAATGCVVAPVILGRSSVSVTMPLKLFPERFLGSYDFRTKLHTNEALPGSAGEIISDLNDFFLDPANLLADQLMTFVTAQTGVSRLVFESVLRVAGVTDADGDGGVIDDAIQTELLDSMPPWFADGLTVGGDVTSVVTNMTVGGKLQIVTVDAAGNFTGNWGWNDFLFTWRYGLGCNPSNACCPGGRHRYSGDDMHLEPVAAEFSGTLTQRANPSAIEYNMVVADHKLSIQYGRLLWFVLENVILPPLTDQNTLVGAIESLFGCDPAQPTVCGCARVGAWIEDQVGIANVGTAICGSAIAAISAQFEMALTDLTWNGSDNSYFTMGIDGVLADADLDLRTDKITGGVSGKLHLDDSSSDFTGDLFGDIERRACLKDAVCTAYEACRAAVDVLDDCAARLVCMPRVGDRVAGQNCSAQSQCKSGVCLGTGVTATCFTTCEQNADCPSALACGQEAADVTVTPTVSLTANACGR
jgi:hypothetical protein